MTTETNFGALKSVAEVEQIGSHSTDQAQPSLRSGLANRNEPKTDLADRFEAGLQWVERIQYRPAIGAAFLAGLVAIGLLTWWIVTPSQTLAIEDQIAFAPEVSRPANDGSQASDNPVNTTGSDDQVSAGAAASPTTPVESGVKADESDASSSQLVVHVVGAVKEPGLVYLDQGARVADAVRAAGGFATQADSELLNLASPVQDGMQVLVPSIGEEITAPLLRPSQLTEPIGPEATGIPAAKVDVNSASVQQLLELRGVGPSIAAAIVDWRQANGPFQSVEDLESVAGIGPAKLEALRDQVIV